MVQQEDLVNLIGGDYINENGKRNNTGNSRCFH